MFHLLLAAVGRLHVMTLHMMHDGRLNSDVSRLDSFDAGEAFCLLKVITSADAIAAFKWSCTSVYPSTNFSSTRDGNNLRNVQLVEECGWKARSRIILT